MLATLNPVAMLQTLGFEGSLHFRSCCHARSKRRKDWRFGKIYAHARRASHHARITLETWIKQMHGRARDFPLHHAAARPMAKACVVRLREMMLCTYDQRFSANSA
jgi:hypothetical protein